MNITPERLDKLCVLAQLELPEEEKNAFLADLERRLKNLSDLPLDGETPADCRTPLSPSKLRSDTVGGAV